jgi:hypothetical protein
MYWVVEWLLFLVILLIQEPEPIDWDYYRKGIGAGIVDKYKEAYDSKFYFLCNLYWYLGAFV